MKLNGWFSSHPLDSDLAKRNPMTELDVEIRTLPAMCVVVPQGVGPSPGPTALLGSGSIRERQ